MAANKRKFDWLGLIDVSGPFLTLSVLNDSFQFGLDAHESETYRAVKEAYDEWEANPTPAIHNAWVRFLLEDVLGYPAEMIGEAQAIPESAVATLESQSERIRPSLVILDAEDPRLVRLPILVYPRTQKLDSPLAGSSWPASPHTRMQVLLQNTGFQVGFVTNGSQWSLVHVRKGEPTGFATWQTMLLTEEKELLQAFVGILGQERAFGTSADQTLFALLDKSSQDQEEVTKELGRQVRQAVEVFVNALDRLDRDSERRLLADVDPKTVYNGALTVMMRLIFLLCAEERGLMDSRPLYVQNYSVGALNDQLREEVKRTGNEDLLEHRHDAWMRLLATFRLVHGGCAHEDLNLPAYGGSLFDPARYPFLERAHVNNRVTLHLLDALEYLEIRLPRLGRETRRLSFRALGVEQIGHVYEGLLDHTAVKAQEPVVGLTGKETEEDEIALSLLEGNASGLGDFFSKRKIKVSGNAEKLLQVPSKPEAQTALRMACGADEELYCRTLPFLNLVRGDSLDHLQVYPKGSLYVTSGTERRSTGTHYTPVILTEEVVQYALEPVVYVGPAEGLPRSEWKLKSAKAIVNLKVCDMAMGSGAFLVQACRYLSERLVEAWGLAAKEAGRPIGFSNEGNFFTKRNDGDHYAKGVGTLIETPLGTLAVADPSAELISDEPEERLAQARRIVADRCLYGVDINPMAVEMAKLSLWLTTMERNRPFTFLDHALKVGDSLISVNLRQLRSFNMLVDKDKRLNTLLLPWVPERVRELQGLRKQILAIPSHDAGSVERKRFILDKFNRTAASLRYVADRLLGIELSRGTRKDKDFRRLSLITELGTSPEQVDILAAQGDPLPETKRFHWELEFADALVDDDLESGGAGQAGFNAFVGNPPFVGGQKITGIMGTAYRDFLVTHLANGKSGSADLCAYFFLNAAGQLKAMGLSGLIATNTIAQGDTREVGLEQVVQMGYTIPRATKSRKWPGDANLEISQVWMFRGQWNHTHVLDGETATTITSFLNDGSASGNPQRLKMNEGRSFQGSNILGLGYTLSSEGAFSLLRLNSSNENVLFPFLNGEDVNSRPDQSPSRWVINFFDWPLGRVSQLLPASQESVVDVAKDANTKRPQNWFPTTDASWYQADDEQRAKWLQIGITPDDYPGHVATDFLDCMRIVEELVRPERAKLAEGDATARDRARRWWMYGRRSEALYRSLKQTRRCLVRSRVSNYHSFTWCPTNIVFSEATIVIASERDAMFAALQSWFHQVWTELNASSMRTDTRYTPSDCFETFPLPDFTEAMDEAGAALHEARRQAMLTRQIGLTDLAHLIHNPAIKDADVEEVRRQIVAVDEAVREAYDWPEIALEHGFYGEGRARRFSVSPTARQAMLRRLLKLNAERYAEEVRRGLHDKKAGRSKVHQDGPGFSSRPAPRRNLFDDQLTLEEI